MLEQQLTQMHEANKESELAKELVQGLIDSGNLEENEDGKFVLTKGPNVIANANTFMK